jgi:6-pyruvoyltetrahydropterin/6-carboxytetrahydropterin synthase
MMQLGQDFNFTASRKLVTAKGQPLHTHKYRLRVVVKGALNEDDMVADAATIRKVVNDLIISKLDNNALNEFFKQPTLEAVTQWIFDELYDLGTEEIVLWENPMLFVRVTGSSKGKK